MPDNERPFPFPGRPRSLSKRVLFWSPTVFAAFLVSLVICGISLEPWEDYFLDLRMKYRILPKPSGRVELIITDSETISRFHLSPGFKEHKVVLEKLALHPPKSIVYVQAFASLVEEAKKVEKRSLPFSGSPEDKKEFIAAAKSFPFFLCSPIFYKCQEKRIT